MTHVYASAAYAESLAHIGRAVDVAPWGGFVLAREISGGGEDLTGAYPLASLAADARLRDGLDALAAAGFVSVVLVPDPLRGPAQAAWAQAFDLCQPFKTHYLIEPGQGYAPTKHHRDRIRRGARRCAVEIVALGDHLAEWRDLYAGLAARRAIGGPAAFSEASFAAMARDARFTAFAARFEGRIVAMTIWFACDGVVYNHLTAADAEGYANGAVYALYDAAVARFGGEGVINLGGGAGFADNADDGLATFKRGFANARVKALLCGAVLDRARYAALSQGVQTDFFPAYRAPRLRSESARDAA